MKIKIQEGVSKTKETKARKVLTKGGERKVEIWHSQEISQNLNYNSVRATYSVKMTVDADEESIQQGIAKCESIVEGPLTEKIKEQYSVLKKL